jgi:rRNA pseudouridine-1189 N-methylase Emg1 (Nep1/Mra1 family)
MPVFENKGVMEDLFKELWMKLINETEFGAKLKENDITLLFVINEPDVVMYVDEKGPLFSDEAKAKVPVITMLMSGDMVNKVLQILPMLKPGQALYPDYCKKYNLPLE